MQRDENIVYLLALTKAAADGTQPPAPGPLVDWGQILKLAQKHNIAGMLCYALDGAAVKPPKPVMDSFAEIRARYIYMDMRQNACYDQLLQRFEQAGICSMALKGYYLQDLYPLRDMRTMSDLDVLLHAADQERADAIMRELGFAARFIKEDERAYMKDGIIGVELHFNLVSENHPGFARYYGDGWSKAKKIDGLAYSYAMAPEDFLIYHLVHLAKHYKVAGTGIRSVLDMYILMREYKDSYDWAYIRKELDTLGLDVFAGNMIQLMEVWFNGRACTPLLAEIEGYMLSGGVYGRADRKQDASLIRDGAVGRKQTLRLKRYFLAVFPTYKTMRGLYPILRRYPVLLPVYWVRRGIQKFFSGKGDIQRVFKTYRDINVDNAKKMAEHFKKIGL